MNTLPKGGAARRGLLVLAALGVAVAGVLTLGPFSGEPVPEPASRSADPATAPERSLERMTEAAGQTRSLTLAPPAQERTRSFQLEPGPENRAAQAMNCETPAGVCQLSAPLPVGSLCQCPGGATGRAIL
jgi:hypothetical protein